MTSSESQPILSAMDTYRDYNSRWVVLTTVFLLNLANNALWISFSSVSDKSAQYYDKQFEAIDWLGTIGFIVGYVTLAMEILAEA